MMLIDNEWCFIHIPKTSGTNLRKSFSSDRAIKYNDHQFWNEFWYDSKLAQIPSFKELVNNQMSDENAGIIKHAPLHFWEKVGVVKNQKIFTIVRNPYTIFLSRFHELKRIIENSMLSMLPINLTLKSMTYDDMITLPFNVCGNKMNQIDYLVDKNNNIRVDRIYKMETDQNKIEIDFNIKNLNENKYNHYNYDRNYKEIFDESIINWIQKTFKRDFDYLNYSINPFW